MKIELTYNQDIWKSLTFNITDADLMDYIHWCELVKYKVEDPYNLVQFLENYCSFEEDAEVNNSYLENAVGLSNALEKCKKLMNDN